LGVCHCEVRDWLSNDWQVSVRVGIYKFNTGKNASANKVVVRQAEV